MNQTDYRLLTTDDPRGGFMSLTGMFTQLGDAQQAHKPAETPYATIRQVSTGLEWHWLGNRWSEPR